MESPRRFLSYQQPGTVEIANRGLDVVSTITAALIIEMFFPAKTENQQSWILLVLIHALIIMLVFQQSGLYQSWRGRPFSDQFSRVLLASLTASAATALIWIGLNFETFLSLKTLSLWFFIGFFIAATHRALLHVSIRSLRSRGFNQKSVILCGAGGLSKSIISQCQSSPESGFKIVALVNDNPVPLDSTIASLPIYSGIEMIGQAIENHRADELWIALPLSAAGQIGTILEITETYHCSVRLFPDFLGLALLNHSVNELLGFPIIDLNVNRMHGINHLLKEAEDKLLGSIFFLLSLPVIFVIALMVRLSSEGPVLFKQKRVGWDGKPFTIYKFRTMVNHQEEHGTLTQACKDDERFTGIGRWLRRSSLDELPQLFNVLQGRMSLVGPRPHAIEHDSLYEQQIKGYIRRNRVKPGITGWAQINDLRGEIESLDDMIRRVKHDLYYIENWSLWFDLRIIVATILKIFFSKKAW